MGTLVCAAVCLTSCTPPGAGPGNESQEEPAGRTTLGSVTDGDTVRVLLASGRDVPVRLIGIDTPEVYFGAECGGPEATAHLESLVSPGDEVVLVVDPTQDRVDRYGRLLRYVVLPDGTDLGEEMVASGWAAPYVYDEPFTRLRAYRAAASRARGPGLGVWSAC